MRQLTDTTRVVRYAQNFEPYGEVLAGFGEQTSNYGFTGEWMDGTGLVYLRARYYAPQTARFISHDTWGGDYLNPLSYNPWLYAYANPVMFIDPSGKCPDIDGDGKCDISWRQEWLRGERPPAPLPIGQGLNSLQGPNYLTCVLPKEIALTPTGAAFYEWLEAELSNGKQTRATSAGDPFALTTGGKKMSDLYGLYWAFEDWWNNHNSFSFAAKQFVVLMLSYEFGPLNYAPFKDEQPFKDAMREWVARSYYTTYRTVSDNGLLNWIWSESQVAQDRWRAIFVEGKKTREVMQRTGLEYLSLAEYAAGGITNPADAWTHPENLACDAPYNVGNGSMGINPPPEGYLYMLPGETRAEDWFLFTRRQIYAFRNEKDLCYTPQ